MNIVINAVDLFLIAILVICGIIVGFSYLISTITNKFKKKEK